jgi:GTP pyrophosphokinase
LTAESFKRLAERFSFTAVEEMYAAVGYGSISINQILFKLIDYLEERYSGTLSGLKMFLDSFVEKYIL